MIPTAINAIKGYDKIKNEECRIKNGYQVIFNFSLLIFHLIRTILNKDTRDIKFGIKNLELRMLPVIIFNF